ncbi:MAG TPA: hypothetical protein VNN12_03165, partial [Dehalococcoidia bacterium]|nr:hypothetical protein [Dehalococcoidia bacterium]
MQVDEGHPANPLLTNSVRLTEAPYVARVPQRVNNGVRWAGALDGARPPAQTDGVTSKLGDLLTAAGMTVNRDAP